MGRGDEGLCRLCLTVCFFFFYLSFLLGWCGRGVWVHPTPSLSGDLFLYSLEQYGVLIFCGFRYPVCCSFVCVSSP